MIALLSAAWGFIVNSRVVQVLAALAAALGWLAVDRARQRATGRKEAIQNATEKDRKNADDIRERARDALRKDTGTISDADWLRDRFGPRSD